MKYPIFAVLTLSPTDALRKIHNRMPLILPESAMDEWISPDGNPNKVVIAEQDYGVCVNQSYGFFLIETEPSGKLENGVITFPAEEVYIGVPGLGKWYITNDDGSFKITLPSAASTTAVKPVANSGNGRVEDLNIISGLRSFEKAKVQIERDAQAVNAKVSVSYDRNAKAGRALRESRISTVK